MRSTCKMLLPFVLFFWILFATACGSSDSAPTSNSLEQRYPTMEFPPAKVQSESSQTADEPTAEADAKPLNYDTMQGVWISYIEYGWALTGKSESEFRSNLQTMFDRLKSKNLNTAIMQVRSHGDAYYLSDCYPWSKYVTGTLCADPGFDPLQIMVEEAHSRDISLHAWINPYRLMKDEDMAALPDSYRIKQWYQDPDYMVQQQDYWYLNPGNAEAQTLILDGVRELVSRYDVDGIQIDDYFYVPSPASFGQSEEEARQNTTALVKGMHDTVKSVNSDLLFGVSPGGNYTDAPRSDSTQYTDLQRWCTEDGYLDYVAPQIYWAFDDPQAPFSEVLAKWKALCDGHSVKLVTGLAAYKFPDSDILTQQTQCAQDETDGYLYFRYDNVFS